jgi:hypothetical protein
MVAMNPLLHDMFGHQFWADAELWKAIGGHAAARDDQAIRDRLHHIHTVQRVFIWGVSDGPGGQFNVTTSEDFPSFESPGVCAGQSCGH